MLKVKEYAKKHNMSEQAVRMACRQQAIKSVVITHKKRRAYWIYEEGDTNEETYKK